MQIRVIGSNIETGPSLNSFVEEHLQKSVTKYFDKAVSGEVHFSKEGQMFSALIIVNEGVKSGIVVKSDGEAGDAYGAFNEALERATKQLRRYKRKIKNYRHKGGGLKSVEPNYKALSATKYVLPPLEYDAFAEMENESEKAEIADDSFNVITEKTTVIEELSVNEAVMKMDLANLPALVFTNRDNKRLNVVYHRKDGNISWINPEK